MISQTKMRHIKALLIILVILLSPNFMSFAQTAQKNRLIKPANHVKRVITIIEGKTRYYYALSSTESSVVSFSGPGILKVISRPAFTSDETESLDYTIVYQIDGGEEKTLSATGIEPSKKNSYRDEALGKPGNSTTFEIEVGRGDHSIEFKKLNPKISVACRYSFVPVKAKKIDWIAYSPSRPAEPVELETREETITYYRFSNEKPMKVEVNGPTQLRVLTRIENHYQMRGRINYRVQVLENNNVINTYQLSSTRSDVTVYKENSKLVPGKACEFVVNVPKGRHTYEFVLLDEDKDTVLGRILLPKKDVKLEQ